MRKLTLILNAIVAVFFAGFLAYTFFAKPHLEHIAREFVTQKTIAYAEPSVKLAEESLESPLVQKFLSEDQIFAIRNEIDEFGNDSSLYVSQLTGKMPQELLPPNANPVIAKIVSLKSEIRSFYDATLQALIADLRIFSTSNMLAGLVAFAMAFCTPSSVRKSMVCFSILMFIAVLYCSSIYIDGLSFFRILFRVHMGWWYAVFLCAMVLSFYWDYGRHFTNEDSASAENETEKQAPPITE